MADNSLPVLRVKHKLSDAELAFLLAFGEEPDVYAAESSAGLERGAGRALLQSKRGKAAMAALLSTQEERYADIQAQLVTMLCRMVSWDPKDAFDESHRLRHPRELPDEIRCAITEFKYYPATGAIEYKFESRLSAIALLQKWFLASQAKAEGGGADGEGRAEWVVRGRQALPADKA